jgi:aromatic-L-amino-acid decarboxylase
VAVVATVGTTSTSSVDPVDAVAEVAERYGAWLHVDAAYAGPVAVLPEMRPLFAGWERADSVVVNPHKWLFTPIDCSVLFMRRPDAVRDAFRLTPEYLRTAETDRATDLMDYGVALGRRFRSLKLWFVLRYFGRAGIEARIRAHIRLARDFAARVDGEPGWERGAPVPFGLVVFRRATAGLPVEEQNRRTREIMERLNRSGEAFLSHTVLRGRVWIRLSVGNLRTTRAHLDRTWEALRRIAAEVQEEARARGPGGTG